MTAPSWFPLPSDKRLSTPSSEERDKTLGMGEEIRRVRQSRGMTQQELADKAGMARTSITNIEAGRQKISLVLLERLAHALNCEVSIQLQER